MTSSDVLDTCLSVQLTQAADLLLADLDEVLAALRARAFEHKHTLTIGRSHGIHAEPTSFGLKLAGHYAEFARNRTRLEAARAEIAVCAISGAVGTFAHVDPSVEAYVAEKLGLAVEPVSTQVIPRDRHAAFFCTLGVIASGIERLATEVRHLQRSEVREAEEFFHPGQKGSSAMPHKRNPVLSENLTGLARIVRAAVVPALENVTLWHERDISHSSVERAIAPDATVTLDFALARLAGHDGEADRPSRADGGEPGNASAAWCIPARCCWRWPAPAFRARTPTGSSSATPWRRGKSWARRRGAASAPIWPPTPRSPAGCRRRRWTRRWTRPRICAQSMRCLGGCSAARRRSLTARAASFARGAVALRHTTAIPIGRPRSPGGAALIACPAGPRRAAADCPEGTAMARRRQLYEGKAKILFEGPEPGTLVQYFKDDATAFNAQKKGIITGKGVLNNRISEYLMTRLGEIGMPTHFVRRLNMREQLIREVEIIPLEVVVRNVAAGSLSHAARHPRGHPPAALDHRVLLQERRSSATRWCPRSTSPPSAGPTPQDLDDMVALTLRINDFLTGLFLGVGITLVDFKLEFGRLWENEEMRIVLADEISPDNCRLWDTKTNEKMDKDRFRRDLGKVEEAYQEVARRLGILPEAGTRDLKGPEMMQ